MLISVVRSNIAKKLLLGTFSAIVPVEGIEGQISQLSQKAEKLIFHVLDLQSMNEEQRLERKQHAATPEQKYRQKTTQQR